MTRLLIVLFLVAANAGSGQAASVPQAGTVRKGPVSDSQLERAIKIKLAKSKMVATGHEHFTVSVKDGVVTFSGKTNVVQHKGTATRMARAAGAVAVNNLIEVSDAARAKAAARLHGDEIASTAKPGQAMPGQPIPRAQVLPRPTISKAKPDPVPKDSEEEQTAAAPPPPRARVLPASSK